MSEDVFEFLALFQGLNPDQLAILRKIFMLLHAPAGTRLFEQGDQAERLYLVVEGEVHIRFKPEDGPEINIARVRENGVVGWSAALGNPTYTSSAVCMTDCQLLRTRGQDLHNLCERFPDTGSLILQRMAAAVAERWRNAHPDVVAILEQGLHNGLDATKRS